MNNFYKSTLMAAFSLFNGSNLALQANEHDEKSNLKAHLLLNEKESCWFKSESGRSQISRQTSNGRGGDSCIQGTYQQFKKQLISSPRIRPHVCLSFSFSRSDARVAGVTGPAWFHCLGIPLKSKYTSGSISLRIMALLAIFTSPFLCLPNVQIRPVGPIPSKGIQREWLGVLTRSCSVAVQIS